MGRILILRNFHLDAAVAIPLSVIVKTPTKTSQAKVFFYSAAHHDVDDQPWTIHLDIIPYTP